MKKIYNFVFVISYFIVLTKIWCDNSQITKIKHVLTRKLFSKCMFYVAPTAVEYFKNQFKSDSYSYTFCIIQFLSQIHILGVGGAGVGQSTCEKGSSTWTSNLLAGHSGHFSSIIFDEITMRLSIMVFPYISESFARKLIYFLCQKGFLPWCNLWRFSIKLGL